MAFIKIAIIASIAAAATSAYGQFAQAQQQSATARYNRKLAENQAIAAQQAAASAAEDKRQEMRHLLGTIRAGAGASGIISGEGSPLLVALATEEQALLDIKRIRYQGAQESAAFMGEAGLQGFYGRTARRGGRLAAGASLIQGIAQASSYAARLRAPAPQDTPRTEPR